MKLLAFLFIGAVIGTTVATEFAYEEESPHGPSHWGEISAFCDGVRQSPINIETSRVRRVNSGFPVIISNANLKSSSIDLANNGHGASFKVHFADDAHILTMGGPLMEPYVLDAFHMHWESEHTLNGRRYAAELHMVHYNAKYGSVANALDHEDGLAVVGFLFEEDTNGRHAENKFIDLLYHVREPDTEWEYAEPWEQISIGEIIGEESFHVYSYPGSLTTPNCNEVVTWLIPTKSLKISSAQLEKLRKIKFEDGHNIEENYRPVQELWDRPILEY